MTGTGTQSDPYVPSTWSEFVTAIGRDAAYVSVPEGTEWDMNEVVPEGIDTEIPVKCRKIEGNGSTIKNLVLMSGGFKMKWTSSLNYTQWQNIQFLNCYAGGGRLFAVGENSNRLYPSFSGVTISGKFVDSMIFYGDYALTYHQMRLNRCSINAELSGGAAFARNSSDSYPCVKLSNCHIRTSGNSTQAATQYMQLENSLWEGDWAIKSSQIVGGNGMVSQYNIFDVAVAGTATVSVNSSYASNVKKCLFNSDKITSGATLASQLVQVTSEQLRDASYLSSIGFPIAT